MKYTTKESAKAAVDAILLDFGYSRTLSEPFTKLLCEACEIDTRTVGQKIADEYFSEIESTGNYINHNIGGITMYSEKNSLSDRKRELSKLIDGTIQK